MPWNPILNGVIKDKAEREIHKINSYLQNSVHDINDVSLMTGKSGIALFFAYHSLYSGGRKEKNLAQQYISEAFESINNGFTYHTFSGGIAGICWTVKYLISLGIIDISRKNELEKLDNYLIQCMLKDMEKGNYDFLHGALGNALYLLSSSDMKNILVNLKSLLEILDSKKQIEENCNYKWLTDLDQEGNLKGYNLGLSHGQTSIIMLLSLFYKYGINREKSLNLIQGAVRYLFQQELDIKKGVSYFPNWIIPGEPIETSRLAWCYGDLGMGIALWQTAKIISDKNLEKGAIRILTHASYRRDLHENNVKDIGICHGIAGIAHIFNRMFQYTGIVDFKEAAKYWLYILLNDSTNSSELNTLQIKDGKQSIRKISLIEGISGNGLVLIAAISNKEPDWDRILLLS